MCGIIVIVGLRYSSTVTYVCSKFSRYIIIVSVLISRKEALLNHVTRNFVMTMFWVYVHYLKLSQKQHCRAVIDICSTDMQARWQLQASKASVNLSAIYAYSRPIYMAQCPSHASCSGLALLHTHSQTLHVMLQLLLRSMKRMCTCKNHTHQKLSSFINNY